MLRILPKIRYSFSYVIFTACIVFTSNFNLGVLMTVSFVIICSAFFLFNATKWIPIINFQPCYVLDRYNSGHDNKKAITSQLFTPPKTTLSLTDGNAIFLFPTISHCDENRICGSSLSLSAGRANVDVVMKYCSRQIFQFIGWQI